MTDYTAEAVRAAMVRGHAVVPRFGRRVTDVLRGMLRPSLIPAKGKQFVVADWNAVEARVTPWASNQPQAQEVLDVFRAGRDIYVREAAGIYRIPESQIGPESDERQIGKVAILSLGFAGGVGAFADYVVQQRAFVGVFAAGLWGHLLHQGHAAWAVDHALGGRAADDL